VKAGGHSSRSASEAAFLSDASVAIGLEPDTTSALRLAARLAVPALGHWAIIHAVDDDGRLARVAEAAAAGAPPADAALSDLAARVALRRLPEYVSVGAGGDPRGARLAMPIVRHDWLLGVLTCGRLTPPTFAPRYLRTADAYARRIAAAIRPRDSRADRIDWGATDTTLAMLAHELRTPVTAVLGWTNLLQTGRLTAPMAARALAAIERSAHTQSRLVTDMFDLSRIMLGTYRLCRAPIDINAVVQGAMDAIAPTAMTRGLDLRCGEIGAAPPYLTGDAPRLQQAITNVLSNAINHTPRGGRIWISIAAEGERVAIRVSDSGNGIPPELLPHIFEPLTRSADVERQDGLGLGLVLVRKIVELHGGAVIAASAGRGRGAVFTLTLPRERPSAPAGGGEDAERPFRSSPDRPGIEG
jgi:signal transduction histidine kinase